MQVYACASPNKPWSTISEHAAHDYITGEGPVVLIYGCSECNWIYRPKTPQEASQMSWVAQVNFEQHICSEHDAGS